jgi:hypothetical protein
MLPSKQGMKTTKPGLSATSHQRKLKTKHHLSNLQFEQMLEMLAALSAAERATLKDPDFITEDEADLIVSDRRMKEPGESISSDEIFAEFGYIPRHRRSA